MVETIKQYAKFIAAVIGVALTAFAGLLPEGWNVWGQAVALFLTGVSVLVIPNALTNRQLEQIAKHRLETGE